MASVRSGERKVMKVLGVHREMRVPGVRKASR